MINKLAADADKKGKVTLQMGIVQGENKPGKAAAKVQQEVV